MARLQLLCCVVMRGKLAVVCSAAAQILTAMSPAHLLAPADGRPRTCRASRSQHNTQVTHRRTTQGTMHPRTKACLDPLYRTVLHIIGRPLPPYPCTRIHTNLFGETGEPLTGQGDTEHAGQHVAAQAHLQSVSSQVMSRASAKFYVCSSCMAPMCCSWVKQGELNMGVAVLPTTNPAHVLLVCAIAATTRRPGSTGSLTVQYRQYRRSGSAVQAARAYRKRVRGVGEGTSDECGRVHGDEKGGVAAGGWWLVANVKVVGFGWRRLLGQLSVVCSLVLCVVS